MWRGEWIRLTTGYLACAVIYQDGSKRVILQHREVMERHLGRELREDEVVHHRDENKENNQIENLEVLSREEHSRHHAEQRRLLRSKAKSEP